MRKPEQSLVCVGKYQDPVLHGLAHLINMALGAVGRTVNYKLSSTYEFNQDSPDNQASLQELTSAMSSGTIDTLVILGSNPIFTAPADLDFSTALAKVKHAVHIGTEADETAVACNWHLPRTHFLEEWSDGLAYNGTAGICQPLIAPMYQGLSLSEFLARFSEYPYLKSYEIVRNHWKEFQGGLDFDRQWRKWLHDGVIENTTRYNIAVKVSYPPLIKECKNQLENIKNTQTGELELLFREHSTVLDGRFANNGWLQELPDPMTRLTWDNAAIMSVHTAEKYGLRKDILLKDRSGIPLGDTYRPMVEITYHSRKIKMPAFILPGLGDDTVLLNYGQGRFRSGRIGQGVGFNIYQIQTGLQYTAGYEASMKRIKGSYELANVQEHWSMKGRDLIRIQDINQPHMEHHGHGSHPSLWDEHKYEEGMQWGMTIDLNRCTACGACVTACQAENNIPIVGKKQVALNREMHWIRIDRYFAGDDYDDPRVAHQAVACHQCEMAPCETVCPVAATAHSTDGLNDMAYNRCIGTRYCANNCPYKVRRFNYFNFTNQYTVTQKMAQNPDVTVRFRGVMEKCTYCIQRINEKRIEYKNKGIETVPDGEIIPACQQACPAGAIVFGNINDAQSRVVALKKLDRNYDLLAELNIRPRTSYLARLTNCNPALAKPLHHDKHHKGS
jgi:molybdopterin-containing oxidoreductase family iron-sulfur binding subunit